ncbi:MAG TPA: hypothetical protein VFE60_02425 [Roseiarcus sp.]|nr:hypothetical protein [Roseiarcus sp.]
MTAFPADAESNLFEGPHPEFFQALAHFAYPGDVRRIREARSEWRAHNPCEYPPLFDERGWDAPRTGEAFKALWLKLEEGDVRSWRRMGKDGPYEMINPSEWRRGRENAMRQILPPQSPPPPGSIVVSTGPLLVGDLFDRRIPEFDFFIVLLVNETFLRDVVVSRDDLLTPVLGGTRKAPLSEIIAFCRSLKAVKRNRVEMDAALKAQFGFLPRETCDEVRTGAGFAGKRGRRPKPK